MDLLRTFIDIFLHLDRHLSEVIQQYGTGTHFILFAVIFCETGLVVTPFLPGDSLLFAAGTFAGLGDLNPGLVYSLLSAASILGDSTNYWVGRFVGTRILAAKRTLIRPQHLERTQEFYSRHGRKTILLARFLPIVRTIAPFVAGLGKMPYSQFVGMSILGSLCWVGVFVWAGYFFGGLQAVRDNFTLVIMAIIGVSLLPMVIEIAKSRFRKPA